jgi:phosphotransferase system  glucose/maltose/N-acetylglucosamine-specific IIC component
VEIPLLFLRLVSIGLLSALGWIHLHLWQVGYRQIPTIGPLFLVAAVATVAVAVAMLVWPSRFIGLLGFGTVMGLLAGLIVSINVGLFGFTESSSAPFVVESIVLEMAAAITLTGWVAVDLMMESRQTERTVRAAATLRNTDPSTGSPRRRAGRRPAAT